MECGIWNLDLVGFADYIIMNYSIKIIIHYSLRSETVCLLSYENAIWKPIPTFPIGKELKQQISSLKRKQMVSPFSLEGDGGGYLFSFDNELLYRVYLNSQHRILRVNRQLHENYTFVKTSY